ncbi:hypothetical protein PATSB16_09230 [Pandoraea thiooxydans]|nr:glycosyltransferase [Pandoraea thiooxydans]APR94265.1 hypothetical protein PATSB16_09230 [Pandoraea thiooxydans]
MEINNLVVVRFSLKLNPEWQEIAYGPEENRSKWFAYRVALFRRFLAASLRRQKVKSLKNFLLMDETDEADYRKFEHLFSDIVTPVFSKDKNHIQQVNEEITRAGYTNIALSRVDSDDALADNYFEEINRAIQRAIENNIRFTHVVATRGYHVTKECWQEVYYNRSPFLTRFCPRFNGENVYDIYHQHVISHPHIQCHSARWIQLIHDTNVFNALIDSQLDESLFIEHIKSNPRRIATQPTPYSQGFPSALSSFLCDLEDMPVFDTASHR